MQDEAILALLTSMDAIVEGEFRLSNGKKTKLYIELGKALQYPDIVSDFGEQIASTFFEQNIDVVISNSPSGIIIGQEIAKQLEIKHIFLEKNSKGKYECGRGFSINPGEKAIIIDDVVATGESIKGMMTCLKKYEVKIKDIFCIVDRASTPLKVKPAVKSLLALRLPQE